MSCYLRYYILFTLVHYSFLSSQDDYSLDRKWTPKAVAAYESAMKAKRELDAMPLPFTRRGWMDPQYGLNNRTRR
jgi:hypothetical protein